MTYLSEENKKILKASEQRKKEDLKVALIGISIIVFIVSAIFIGIYCFLIYEPQPTQYLQPPTPVEVDRIPPKASKPVSPFR